MDVLALFIVFLVIWASFKVLSEVIFLKHLAVFWNIFPTRQFIFTEESYIKLETYNMSKKTFCCLAFKHILIIGMLFRPKTP